MMKICVKQPSNGEVIPLAARDGVKLKIEHATRIPAAKQSLIFRGGVVRGLTSLRDCGVPDSATLQVDHLECCRVWHLARTMFNASDACSGAEEVDASSSPVPLHLESLLGLDCPINKAHNKAPETTQRIQREVSLCAARSGNLWREWN